MCSADWNYLYSHCLYSRDHNVSFLDISDQLTKKRLFLHFLIILLISLVHVYFRQTEFNLLCNLFFSQCSLGKQDVTIWCPFRLCAKPKRKFWAIVAHQDTHTYPYTHTSILKITLYQLSRVSNNTTKHLSRAASSLSFALQWVCVSVLQMTPYYTAPLVQQMVVDIKQEVAFEILVWPWDVQFYLRFC